MRTPNSRRPAYWLVVSTLVLKIINVSFLQNNEVRWVGDGPHKNPDPRSRQESDPQQWMKRNNLELKSKQNDVSSKVALPFRTHHIVFSCMYVHPTCTYVQRVVLPTKQTIRSAGGEIINNYLNFFYLYARPCTHMSSSSSCYQLIFGIGALCQHFNVSLTSCSYDNIIKNLSKLLKIKT